MAQTRFFEITYKEKRELRKKYLMLDSEPKMDGLNSAMLAVVSEAGRASGGIYGGSNCPYKMFISRRYAVTEISAEDFAKVLLDSLKKNYVERSTVRDVTRPLI